ncbi:arsenate reductase (glutaredoxin) [Microbaculum marinum]|uniref:Arsenate reductase n=1 Tax=Microbaculum marinum TaxID=1764581 RepID=A0AAW9RQD0_9HYPH
MTVTIWHNPRCSKSRQTLALIREKGIEPEIVEYLKTPPDAAAIRGALKKLGIGPRDLLRKGEAAYKARKLSDTSLSDDALIQAMAEEPVLIERPVVMTDGRAALGRPPEAVLEVL